MSVNTDVRIGISLFWHPCKSMEDSSRLRHSLIGGRIRNMTFHECNDQ